jgi:hypothetical protein
VLEEGQALQRRGAAWDRLRAQDRFRARDRQRRQPSASRVSHENCNDFEGTGIGEAQVTSLAGERSPTRGRCPGRRPTSEPSDSLGTHSMTPRRIRRQQTQSIASFPSESSLRSRYATENVHPDRSSAIRREVVYYLLSKLLCGSAQRPSRDKHQIFFSLAPTASAAGSTTSPCPTGLKRLRACCCRVLEAFALPARRPRHVGGHGLSYSDPTEALGLSGGACALAARPRLLVRAA